MIVNQIENLTIQHLFRRGNWSNELNERAQAQWRTYPSDVTLKNYIDCQHATRGFTSDAIVELLDRVRAHKNGFSTNLYYRLHALCQEYEISPNSSLPSLRAAKHLRYYPALAATQLDNRSLQNKTVQLAHSLLARTQPLTQALSTENNINRICIVGNAPTELGKDQQQHIDSADVIFRFNNANTDLEFHRAYGSLTHYWVISPSFSVQNSSMHANKIVVSGVAPFHKRSLYWQKLAALESCSFYTFPNQIWYSLVQKLDAPPSAGLLCLATLMRWRAECCVIESYGISSDVANKRNHYGDLKRRSSRHNWSQESALVREILGNL